MFLFYCVYKKNKLENVWKKQYETLMYLTNNQGELIK